MTGVVGVAEVLEPPSSGKLHGVVEPLLSIAKDRWCSQWVKEAAQLLDERAFPTNRDELWRQTPPTLFPWSALAEASEVQFELFELHSDTPFKNSGIALVPADHPSIRSQVRALLEQDAQRFPLGALEALRRIMLPYASVVHVQRGTTLSTPLELRPVRGGAVVAPWVIVIVEQGASVHMVQGLRPSKSYAHLFDFSTMLCSVQANAQFNFTSITNADDSSTIYQLHRLYQERDSRSNCFHTVTSGAAARFDIDVVLSGSGASTLLSQAYLSDGDRHVDFHPSQIHDAAHCGSDLYCKGVATDRARSVYYGFIRVAEGAQRTDAYQKNRNLLLSSDARTDAIPNLEIKANDVKCSHGASVSQLGGDELFYLMSRGLSRDAAQRLLVEAFFADLLVRERSEDLRGRIETILLERLRNGSTARPLK